MYLGTRENMFKHIEHRGSGVAVKDCRHRAHAAETGETEKNQPVFGHDVAVGSRKTQTENVGRSHETSTEN